jgi:hypothetical protein
MGPVLSKVDCNKSGGDLVCIEGKNGCGCKTDAHCAGLFNNVKSQCIKNSNGTWRAINPKNSCNGATNDCEASKTEQECGVGIACNINKAGEAVCSGCEQDSDCKGPKTSVCTGDNSTHTSGGTVAKIDTFKCEHSDDDGYNICKGLYSFSNCKLGCSADGKSCNQCLNNSHCSVIPANESCYGTKATYITGSTCNTATKLCANTLKTEECTDARFKMCYPKGTTYEGTVLRNPLLVTYQRGCVEGLKLVNTDPFTTASFVTAKCQNTVADSQACRFSCGYANGQPACDVGREQ